MRTSSLILLLAAVAGCHTVGNPFVHQKPDYSVIPTEAMKTAAAAIESAVQRGDREAVIASQQGVALDDALVRQAIRTRTIRSAIVKELLASGFACEKRNGLLYILRSQKYKQATQPKDRDRDAGVVMSENSDRWALYEGIAKANNLPARAISAIQAIFFEARVACMEEGQAYEDESGAIVSKGR